MAIIEAVKLILIGLGTGALGGVVGGGADALIVPLLVGAKLSPTYTHAIGTSLGTLLPPIGIFAVYKYWKFGAVNIWYSIILAIMFTVGSWLLAGIALEHSSAHKKIYGIFLIILGIITLIEKK